MNNQFETTAFPAGDFISERAVRGAPARRPQRAPTHPAQARDGQPAERETAADGPSPRASRSRRLRRWSVAELIAQAVARPHTGGVAH